MAPPRGLSGPIGACVRASPEEADTSGSAEGRAAAVVAPAVVALRLIERTSCPLARSVGGRGGRGRAPAMTRGA